MAVRPAVLDLLNDMDPASPFTHADGSGFTADEMDLALGATIDERVEAAEARLIARSQASQSIRAHLVEALQVGGMMTARLAARLVGGVTLRLDKIPHTELIKLLDPAAVTSVTPADMHRTFGDTWTAQLAGEARLPTTAVEAILRERAASDADLKQAPDPVTV